MKYSPLGNTGLSVSRVCLGTMTWGQQNSEAEGHAQMDYAIERGINFFDTAELYAVPTSKETYGRTEEIIGTWFKKGNRDKTILATKVAGGGVKHIRDGSPLTGKSVRLAIEGSLKRLQTDYVDLYQLHWTNHDTPHFGVNHAGEIDFTAENTANLVEGFLDILHALDECVKAGKVRFVGLSDDTAWSIMKYLELAEKHGLPRMQSIQNEFSLLCRSDDPYLAEVCVRENIAYMPWSPLAAGILSGKYANGNVPAGSRWDVSKKVNNGRFESFRNTPDTHAAVEGYHAVAKKYGLDPCQMALKFVDQQCFVTSTIIGATNMQQLTSNIDAFDLTLSDEVMKEIDAVYRKYPLPY